MIKRHPFLLITAGFILIAALALWPGRWSPPAYANVTLISFTARSPFAGQPEIYVEWATATQYGTQGFFVTRSDSATGTFTRVSDFIPSEGDDITGWAYGPWIDEDVVLGHTYWYKLEELTTSQQSEFYGPISVVSGVPPTETPTATATPTASRTPTRTPTSTPSSTATPTTKPATSSSGAIATPRLATGVTITPRPTSSGGSSLTTPVPTATPSPVASDSQQPAAEATSVPSVPDVTTAMPAITAVVVTQETAPTLAPTDTAPAVVAPVVIVTEAAPLTTASSSPNSTALFLIGAAFLFLVIAFVILRQARQ